MSYNFSKRGGLILESGLIFFNPSPEWAYIREWVYFRENTVYVIVSKGNDHGTKTKYLMLKHSGTGTSHTLIYRIRHFTPTNRTFKEKPLSTNKPTHLATFWLRTIVIW
jgi:hypothetical protein